MIPRRDSGYASSITAARTRWLIGALVLLAVVALVVLLVVFGSGGGGGGGGPGY